MSNFIPGPLAPVPASFMKDFAVYSEAVHAAVSEPDHPYSIPESGDRPVHALEIAERLMSIDPTGYAGFVVFTAAGDHEKATNGVRNALQTAFELDPNLFTINGCISKDLNRYVLREVIVDTASADSTADYVGPTEARKSAYQICKQRGWLASDLIEKSVALGDARRQAAVDREIRLREESRARIREKSKVSNDMPTWAPSKRRGRGTVFG